jgi:hypothetical protein
MNGERVMTMVVSGSWAFVNIAINLIKKTGFIVDRVGRERLLLSLQQILLWEAI